MRSAHLGRDQNSPKEFWAEPPVLEAEAFSVSVSQQGFVHLAACPDSSELPTSRPGFPEPRQSAEARPPQPPLTQTLHQVAPSSATIDPQPEHPKCSASKAPPNHPQRTTPVHPPSRCQPSRTALQCTLNALTAICQHEEQPDHQCTLAIQATPQHRSMPPTQQHSSQRSATQPLGQDRIATDRVNSTKPSTDAYRPSVCTNHNTSRSRHTDRRRLHSR